jgi:hypothetical protein
MLRDLHLKFPGFHGSAGRCHIRLARASRTDPLVVVCSQYTHYYGTSVTNALEIIAATLFEQIAEGRIADVFLDTPIPFREEWSPDANWFDKILARTNPDKYGSGFLTRRIDVPKAFASIIWIENFPLELTSSLMAFKHVSAVTLDEAGSPVWHHRLTRDWMIEETGFTAEELLPPDDLLDLRLIDTDVQSISATSEETLSVPGYHHVRWTKELLDRLPSLLSSARASRGRLEDSDLEESAVHDEIEKFFAVSLPVREVFTPEFPFSKLLNIYTRGAQKAVDFALFKPEGNVVDSLLEVKRTSTQSSGLRSDVAQDIARLLLLANSLQCTCYLLVCGATNIIDQELRVMRTCLSLVDEDADRDKRFAASDLSLNNQYAKLLQEFTISIGYSRLQGITYNGSNCVVLWQIAVQEESLRMHRPYEFNLTSTGR